MGMLPPSAGYGGINPGTFAGGFGQFNQQPTMGAPIFQRMGTLTPQQQQIANSLQLNMGTVGTSGPPSLNPQSTANYIQQSVAAPLLRQYDQTIMPRLNDAYASVGALMGSRRGFAQSQALNNLQTTIGSELGKAQLQNMQLGAQLGLGYNNLGGQLTGQPHMAIQPYQPYQPGTQNGMNMNFSLPNQQLNQSQIAANALAQLPSNPFFSQSQSGLSSFDATASAQQDQDQSSLLAQLLGG